MPAYPLYKRFERRMHKRFPVDDLRANFTITSSKEQLEGECLIKDISYNGLGLDIFKKLKDKVYFLILITVDNLNIEVTAGGKVIWLKRYNGNTFCGIKLDWFSDKSAYINYLNILKAANGIA